MAQKRSTNKAAERTAAAQAAATNAEAAASETAAKPKKGPSFTKPAVPGAPSRTVRRAEAKREARVETLRDNGIDVPLNRTRNVKLTQDPVKPHRRAKKDAAQIGAERAADVGRLTQMRQGTQSAGQDASDAALIRQTATNKYQSHLKEVAALKKKFPKVAAIQAIQPKSYHEIVQEVIAGGKTQATVDSAKPLTPSKMLNQAKNSSLGAETNTAGVPLLDQNRLLRPAVDVAADTERLTAPRPRKTRKKKA